MLRICWPNEESSCRTKPFGSGAGKSGPGLRSAVEAPDRVDSEIRGSWDEVFVMINGERQYLWRAVDQDGDLIDILVQPRRERAGSAEILPPTVEQSATGTRAARDRQVGQLPCRPSGTSCLWSPMTRRDTRTIGPKCRTNPRDNGSVRCAASRHPPTRSVSCTFTASFKICFAWVGTG